MNYIDPTGLCNGFEWIFSPLDYLKEYIDNGGCPDYEDQNLTQQECFEVLEERRKECQKLVGTVGAKSCFDKAMQEFMLCSGAATGNQ